MNISGMDYPDQVANNHLAEPTYIQTVDALLYCWNKRTTCTALIKLTVIMYLFCCPPTGIISHRTCLYACPPPSPPHESHWEPQHPCEQLCVRHITETQKTKYWTHTTMQTTATVSQVGMQVVWLGYRTPSLLLNTNHSRFLTLLAQSTSSSLLPAMLTLSLELILRSHYSFTPHILLKLWAGISHLPWPGPGVVRSTPSLASSLTQVIPKA